MVTWPCRRGRVGVCKYKTLGLENLCIIFSIVHKEKEKKVSRARDATVSSPSPRHHLCPCRLSRVRVVVSVVAVGAVGAGGVGVFRGWPFIVVVVVVAVVELWW